MEINIIAGEKKSRKTIFHNLSKVVWAFGQADVVYKFGGFINGYLFR